MSEHQRFAELIKSIRLRAAMTRQECAELMAVTERVYTSYETGERLPRWINSLKGNLKAMGATDPEIDEMLQLWFSRQDTIHIKRTRTLIQNHRDLEDDNTHKPVSTELRNLQLTIDYIRSKSDSTDIEGAKIIAGMLDAVQRITDQGLLYINRTPRGVLSRS